MIKKGGVTLCSLEGKWITFSYNDSIFQVQFIVYWLEKVSFHICGNCLTLQMRSVAWHRIWGPRESKYHISCSGAGEMISCCVFALNKQPHIVPSYPTDHKTHPCWGKQALLPDYKIKFRNSLWGLTPGTSVSATGLSLTAMCLYVVMYEMKNTCIQIK